MPVPVIERPSPNFGPRNGPVSMVVLHYTGMPDRDAALSRLTDPAAKVSAHYLIDEHGETFRLVAESNRAWHAGVGFWHGIRDINSASIGIELVNPGHEFGYVAFRTPQIATLIDLMKEIGTRHRIAPRDIVGHSDIAPSRKTDPGELFPWPQLAKAGLGFWPAGSDLGADYAQSTVIWMLSRIGYAVPTSPELGADVLDPANGLVDVVKAFQRRYRPAKIDGVIDAETAGLVSGLVRMAIPAA